MGPSYVFSVALCIDHFTLWYHQSGCTNLMPNDVPNNIIRITKEPANQNEKETDVVK